MKSLWPVRFTTRTVLASTRRRLREFERRGTGSDASARAMALVMASRVVGVEAAAETQPARAVQRGVVEVEDRARREGVGAAEVVRRQVAAGVEGEQAAAGGDRAQVAALAAEAARRPVGVVAAVRRGGCGDLRERAAVDLQFGGQRANDATGVVAKALATHSL